MTDEQPHNALERMRLRALWLLGFLGYCLTRFSSHGGTKGAAALTSTTLPAFVPLLTISLAVFSAFEAFSGLRVQNQGPLFAWCPRPSSWGASVARTRRRRRQGV